VSRFETDDNPDSNFLATACLGAPLTNVPRYGITVGPALIKGWDKTWSTEPVIYEPTVAGDFCLALPGGMVARDMINQAAVKCPKSSLFLSGYSQGAMVVRNGVAYANAAAKKRVKVSFHFFPSQQIRNP
jgi:hypothetical protein